MRNISRNLLSTCLEEIQNPTEKSNFQPIRNLTCSGPFLFNLRGRASFRNLPPKDTKTEEEFQGTNR